jgi:putative Ca2+/H+ antiporter (TMEM165/GDT1 family)
MSLDPIMASTLLVVASEMGDKTQLLAFSLAARFRKPWPIMAGIFLATVFNHGLASSVGSWTSTHVPPRVMALVLGALFIGFGLWTLKPDTLDAQSESKRYGPFLTSLVLFFLAEMGDKTQMATVALAAQYRSVTLVTIGTTIGMMIADGAAVFLGDKLAGKVQMKKVRWAAASIFFVFGVASLWKGMTLAA